MYVNLAIDGSHIQSLNNLYSTILLMNIHTTHQRYLNLRAVNRDIMKCHIKWLLTVFSRKI
jgi:hypothetical protein